MKAKGNCYQNSARTLLHDTFFEDALLLHAVVRGIGGVVEDKAYTHAWLEMDGDAFDFTYSMHDYEVHDAHWYRKLGRLYVPTVCTYNRQQLQKMLDEHQTWGPWDEFICKVGEQEPMKHDDFLKFSNNTFLFSLDG